MQSKGDQKTHGALHNPRASQRDFEFDPNEKPKGEKDAKGAKEEPREIARRAKPLLLKTC